MINSLEAIEKRYNEIEQELTTPEVINDIKKMTELSKEQRRLTPIMDVYKEYKIALSDLETAKEMQKDPEMEEFAKEEIASLNEKIANMDKELEVLLLPHDPNDEKNVIVEIRGAAGGDEANIFAGDLFDMYNHYINNFGWKVEVLNEEPGSAGGYSQIEFMIKGEGAYSKLKYESGAHRVQRVPETESGGRVHTSTATVVVMPEVDIQDIEIKESDLKIDVYHSSGAGGQSVNTSNSAVRITHVPTNTVVTCQIERSQLKNKERAMQMLATKLHDEAEAKRESAVGAERKSKVGTGDRSEKIRTYNYPQNRVTDHRINFSIMELDKVMEGNIDPIIEALITEDQRLKLEGK